MTEKTKKQLRAEAVERLKDAQTDNLDWMLLGDECPNWVNYDTLSYNKAVRERVADLLTDDGANDDSTPEKVVSGSEPCVTPESCRQYADQWKQGDDADCESCDSREKLEADALNFANGFIREHNGAISWNDELYQGIIKLLDRQAAITEEQTRCKWVTASADEIAAWRFKAEKLKEQVYELTAERDKLQEQLRIGWECECRLQAERDHYRSKFGKCLDYADAIHALMDDEGMA